MVYYEFGINFQFEVSEEKPAPKWAALLIVLISEQAALLWLKIENLSQFHNKPLVYTGIQGTKSKNMLDHDKWEKNIKFPISEIFSVFFFRPAPVKYD